MNDVQSLECVIEILMQFWRKHYFIVVKFAACRRRTIIATPVEISKLKGEDAEMTE